MKQFSRFLLLAAVLTLFGCKENLYSELTEQDVNMMVAILDQNNIKAERHKDDKNKYTLRVESEDFTKAVQVLAAKGYPKKKFLSLGDVFSSEGIVKTPDEQRIRLIHGMNQELSRSISEIEGVISARVHITPIEENRFGKSTEQPKAAVIVLHYPAKDMSSLRPKIKQIIAHSVKGMTYENVTVVMSAVNSINSKSEVPAEVNIKQYASAKKTNISTAIDEADKTKSIAAKKSPYTGSYIFTGLTSRQFLSWLLVIIGIALTITSVLLWRKAKQNDS